MATSVVSTHIEIDDKGVASITGANTKVVEVVLDKVAYGWSPEEIHFQHPHLSLAQIHSALAYYYDHREKFDAEIEERRQEAERLRAGVTNPALRQKLLGLKLQR
jgi:uncharacterized protein (DUF433 family)